MNKLLLFCLCLLLSNVAIFAQNLGHYHNGVRCAFDHVVQKEMQANPQYKQQIDRILQESLRRGKAQQFRNNYTIPVAVHVVLDNPLSKIQECHIIEQIDILNEDYGRMNPDTINLRPIFNNVVANPQIQFRLDTIIWKNTTQDFSIGLLDLFSGNMAADSAKVASAGGSQGLDPSKYLNIWICNVDGGVGLLGYAYPPDSLSNWPAGSSASAPELQGVVLHYPVVGDSSVYTISGFGGSQSVPVKGRTATHEVGHYLGLRHISGDPQNAPDPCVVDDYMNDTPPQAAQSEFDCNPTQNSCTTDTFPDMIENYMDYSSEFCMNSFTKDQVALFHGVLGPGGQRDGLATTVAKNRISNDYVLHADVAVVNPTAACTQTTAGTTQYATETMYGATPCLGTVARDVWYTFTANSTVLDLEFSNVNAVQGTTTAMYYEVLSGECKQLQNVDCGVAGATTLSGLVIGETYYLRIFSQNPADAQTFDICLKPGVAATTRQVPVSPQAVAIYPNPSSGMFSLDVNTTVSFQGTVVVRDLLGRAITNELELDNSASSVQLDLSSQNNGIYLVEMNINGRVITKKVIVQK